MGASAALPAAARCCQEDQSDQFPVELDTDCQWDSGQEDDGTPPHRRQCGPDLGRPGGAELFQSVHYREGPPWGCCKADDEPFEHPAAASSSFSQPPLETLSYLPMRFDESPTIDIERSHARYSKIVVHSSRARTQRRSKSWEDWIRVANAGRAVTLLSGVSQAGDADAGAVAGEGAGAGEGAEAGGGGAKGSVARIPAMYHLDRTLCRLSILPVEGVDIMPIPIMVDSIQVICPASDFGLLFDQVDTSLSEAEKGRAVMIQYVTDAEDTTGRKRVCILVETEVEKDCFIKALTALWLEKRNDHSMWF